MAAQRVKKPASKKTYHPPAKKKLKKISKPAAIKSDEKAELVSKKSFKDRFKREPIPTRPPLPNVLQLTQTSGLLLWRHWRLFTGIVVTYGFLNLVFAQGLASAADVTNLKDHLTQLFSGHVNGFTTSLTVFVVLLGSSANGSANASSANYQVFLLLLTSLALIWAFRQTLAGTHIRIRDSFYRGMYPLVPFILLIAIIGLELLPLIVGSSVFSIVINNGIAVQAIEKLFWGLIFAALAFWSLFMITSSVIALYIITLPDMTPLKALRSASRLVRGRRLLILRKVFFMPVVLTLIGAIIMTPVIVYITPLAQWVFFVLTLLSLAAVHSYMYTLYRELLNE